MLIYLTFVTLLYIAWPGLTPRSVIIFPDGFKLFPLSHTLFKTRHESCSIRPKGISKRLTDNFFLVAGNHLWLEKFAHHFVFRWWLDEIKKFVCRNNIVSDCSWLDWDKSYWLPYCYITWNKQELQFKLKCISIISHCLDSVLLHYSHGAISLCSFFSVALVMIHICFNLEYIQY